MYAVIDFETRSRASLPKCGTSVYARDPSTEVLCLGYQIMGRTTFGIKVWKPGDPNPFDLFDLIKRGCPVVAHNAGFERAIWYYICHQQMGWPDVPFEQWNCSLAACSRLALPRGLDQAAEALGLQEKKDAEGHKLMLKMCKPKKDGTWEESPANLERLYQYCAQDIAAEVALVLAIPGLTLSEQIVWQLDQKINMRGLPIDMPAVEAALDVVSKATETACKELQEATNGVVKSPNQVAKLSKWLLGQGVHLPNLTADAVQEALRGDLTPFARKALEIRANTAKASTAKLKAMLSRSNDDHRVRGSMIYHGAGTGRWAGVGLQVQNFPRGTMSPDEVEDAHKLFGHPDPQAIGLVLGPPLEVVSSSLRSMICAPPEHRLMVCDFASIEARVLAWVAGETGLIKEFQSGGDVYKTMASVIYETPVEDVDKEQRFVGKTAILGLGYGMGHKAFKLACKTMAKVKISQKMAKLVVKKYREKNARIRAFWGELNSATIRTVETGKPHRVGRLEIRMEEPWLTIQLPSKRKLHYYGPVLGEVVAPWSIGHTGKIQAKCQDQALLDLAEDLDVTLGKYEYVQWRDCDFPKGAAKEIQKAGYKVFVTAKTPKMIPQVQYKSVNSLSRKWTTNRTYGGKLTENVVQAIARDFLVEAMLRVEEKGYPIIATIHDEIVAEMPEGKGTMLEFEHIMSQVPAWGRGCPVGVEGFEARRYRK